MNETADATSPTDVGREGHTEIWSLALLAMVMSVAGNCLILTIFGFSTIVSPVIGRLNLAGQPGATEVNEVIFGSAAFALLAVPGLLRYSVGPSYWA